MRLLQFTLVWIAAIPSLANCEDTFPSASSPKSEQTLSTEQKQENSSLLEKKLTELRRIQEDIKQLRDDLNEQQQVGLELHVFEINQTKLRNVGFSWEAISGTSLNGAGKDPLALCKSLAHNNLAKIFGGRNKQTTNGSSVTFLMDDGAKTALSFTCTPAVKDEGKIRLTLKYEISRFASEDFGLRVRTGETTIEIEPDSAFLISGDSVKRTKANGDKEEVELEFVIKPYLPNR
jgi:Flp pilus assembly secretin CpaC